MLWLIIFGGIGMILFVIITCADGFDPVLSVIGAAAGLAIGAVVSLAPNGICAIWYSWHWHESGSISLQSIATGTTTSGHFFLGSGYIDQSPVYTYFVKNPDGSFYRDSVPANSALIVESTEPPHMEIFDSQADNAWLNYFSGGLDEHSYTFYVPPGSVTQDYTLKP